MKTFYAPDRKTWRDWLEKNHKKENEVWLVYYRKFVGKPRVEYSDAVEEALCFGWIDSTQKGIDEERVAQRYTPRRPKSNWSESNRERARNLIKQGLMRPAGAAILPPDLDNKKLVIAPDILKELKKDPEIWKNFEEFDERYKIIRIGWIEGSRKSPQFKQRLSYFLKMTKKNKKYGMLG